MNEELTLKEITALAKTATSREQELKALTSVLRSIDGALGDLVGHLDGRADSESSIAGAIVEALSTALSGLNQKPPEVSVKAPVVQVEGAKVAVAAPTVNVAAPNVTVNPVIKFPEQKPAASWRSLKIEITDYDGNGFVKSMRVTRE